MKIRTQGLDKIIAEVLEGKQRIVSYSGTSQYQTSGSGSTGMSACGLAALNCARTIFRFYRESVSSNARVVDIRSLLDVVLCQETAKEIISICSSWPSNDHLEVDELLKIPLFKQSFDYVKVNYALSEHRNFLAVLGDMVNMKNTPVAAVITRTPEIVVCVKVPSSINGDVFIVFDSHPRPSHPLGSGFIVNVSVEATAAYLHGLLALDPKILADPTMRWQAQLFGQFSSHMIIPKTSFSSPSIVEDILMEASVMILHLKADIADSKRREEDLLAENNELKAQVSQIQWSQEADAEDIKGKRPDRRSPEEATSQMLSSLSNPEGRHRLSTPSSSSQIYSKNASQDPVGVSKLDLDFITQLQIQYDEEDGQLTAERTALSDRETPTFQCKICLDEMQIDHIAQLSACTHSFCRDCLREHVISTINQGRYPVLCPVCTANNMSNPTSLDDNIFWVLGLADATLELIQSLQIAPYCTVLHCRKCKETMFVDRNDHQESSIISCPLHGCSYVWCKNCEQEIDIGGPQHSCDGSSELKHLMQRRGWRACPGCRTPFQKDSGCNHMTCLSPGCNTHFCYMCGEMMTQSVVRSEIRAAISAHFRRCQLFEDIPDADV